MVEREYQNQLQLASKITAVSVNDTVEALVIELNDQSVIEALAENNRGKVVYVDVWATWCGNCLAEFPHSVELHQKLDSEKITFAYIAIDSQLDEWNEVIRKKHLNGQHILLNREQELEFIKIHFGESHGIPRYLIIDKNGKLINNNAPRPSDKETEKLLRDLMD
ncbi:MAG: TlpA disulfide reductase family protein [Bacteroidia bacterium]|nr:TlpA disulfide reductase family protein [Bacteroidia bacterium]